MLPQPTTTSQTRRRPGLGAATAIAALALAVLSGPVASQTAPSAAAAPPGLPPAIATATTIEGVIAALGAGRPEPSTHLLLDVPQVAAPGRIQARARSTLPATGALILMRGAPAALPGALGAAPAAAPPAPAPGPAAASGPVLLAAMLVRSGQTATMNVQLDLDRTQRFTLLVYAQGRWYLTTREVKIGKAKGAAAP
jgi:hypothetical protein